MHWKHETDGTFQNFEQLSELSPICIIENDKCSGQYKSTNTLRKWMQFAVTWTIVKNWKIVAMFSIVGHDKGEVDNVYSLAKLAEKICQNWRYY